MPPSGVEEKRENSNIFQGHFYEISNKREEKKKRDYINLLT
jgi:hypothetical protein